ncbi:hypothetical protein B0A48_02225 [Cryoendolithus antarcticus]|uniref:Uncharacterized protein n=1 Tax=Cryoendolithus antarcticus TaxID=1507870 RepID=A0A1V8TND0_9PEZI|nr:hypothetical protein B0A48_02225 [Cryoendolithus antarcticus]
MTAVSANDASVLFCSQGDGGNCGAFATYTNEKVRQTVSSQAGGAEACLFVDLRKHTNKAGFWYNADITGKNKGDNIGYNPTGKSINLKNPTFKTGAMQGDLDYLEGRCRNEFGWAKLDITESNEHFYQNLPDILG